MDSKRAALRGTRTGAVMRQKPVWKKHRGIIEVTNRSLVKYRGIPSGGIDCQYT